MKKITILAFCLSFFPLMIHAQLSGTRLVPSANYPDMQSVVDSLNTYGSVGNGIIFQIAGGSVFQSQPLTITASGTETAPVSIVWDGASTKPVIEFSATAAANEAGFLFQGSDYFTLDGLKITNPDGNLDFGIWISNQSSINGAHHNLVKNCEITLNKLNPVQTVGVFVAPATAATSLEGNNNYNRFHNNILQNMTMGYSFDGSNSNTTLMSVGNEVASVDGGESIIEDLVMAGVLLDDQNGFTLSGNTIRNIVRIGTGTTAPAGISTTSGNPSATLTNPYIITNNKIYYLSSSFTSIFGVYLSGRKATYHVAGNLVYGVNASGGGGNTADGIALIGTDIIAYIYNNMVADIAAPASAVSGNAATRGINVRTYLEAYLYHNTVFLEYDATNLSHQSAAFIIYNNSDPVEMRNNVFVNKTHFPEGATGIGAAFYKRTPALTNVMPATNNNIYYAGEPSANNVIFYGHNSSAPAIDQTLEAYMLRAATFDQQSFTEDVPFLSGIDLHILPTTNTLVRGNAVPVLSPIAVNLDFDGQTRDASNPDIGADELANPFPTTGQNPIPADGSTNVAVSLAVLQWTYVADPMYVDPVAFKVYLHDSPDFTAVEPIAIVPFSTGQNLYQVPVNTLSYESSYYWKVVPTLDAQNGPDAQGVQTWQFSTAIFVFPYPNVAANPNPSTGAVVPVTLPALQWDFVPLPNYTAPAGFKVYLSENETPGAADLIAWVPYVSGQSNYQAGLAAVTLNYEAGYHWKVVPAVNEVSGPDAEGVEVWSFSTAIYVYPYPNPAGNPIPVSGTVVPVTINALSWDFNALPNYTAPAGFKVYLSESETPGVADLIAWVPYVSGQSNYMVSLSSFFPDYNTAYHWKVVPAVSETAGPDAQGVVIWSFTTALNEHPSPAANPDPGIGGVIRLGNALAVHFGWEFMPDPDHVLPVAFKVFAAADTNSAYWTTPVGFVNYEPGITSYSLDLLDSPNFDYSFMVPNYWKVVPTTALPAGLDALNVQPWNFHFDEYLGVGDISMNRSFISPNPAKEQVFVNLLPDSKCTIRLLSANGKELQTYSTNERIQLIDLKDLRNGIYYLRVENGKSIETHKLIISR